MVTALWNRKYVMIWGKQACLQPQAPEMGSWNVYIILQTKAGDSASFH